MQSAPSKTAPLYKAAAVPGNFLSADTFIQPWNERDIQTKIQLIIDAEAPLSLSMLTRRVVQSYGIARAGSRIQGHLNNLLRKMNPQATMQQNTIFYWKKDQAPDEYAGFRVSGEGENHRDIRDVPFQEIANAITLVLYEQIGMGQDDLIRETANKLGYTRLGNNVLTALDSGIQYAQAQGSITTGAKDAFALSTDGIARAEATLKSF